MKHKAEEYINGWVPDPGSYVLKLYIDFINNLKKEEIRQN